MSMPYWSIISFEQIEQCKDCDLSMIDRGFIHCSLFRYNKKCLYLELLRKYEEAIKEIERLKNDNSRRKGTSGAV